MNFRILYQDDYLVAVDKPSGYHVHPPEDFNHRISKSVNCLYLLNKQLNTYLYPVHRLDRATSGVLIFALKPDTAQLLCGLFQKQEIKKTYFCVVRGWTQENGVIDHALKSEKFKENGQRLQATTSYRRSSQSIIHHAVSKYPSGRYSLVCAEPHSGRMHQIRRHFAHISHPLIGDSVYGDSDHNRLFKEKLNIKGLLLKAYSIEFVHPHTQVNLKITARWNGLWHQVFDIFEMCPYDASLQKISSPKN